MAPSHSSLRPPVVLATIPSAMKLTCLCSTAKVTSKVKEAAQDVSGKTNTGAAAEIRGEAKGKVQELKGEAKGKAAELKGDANQASGTAKGKAYEANEKSKGAADKI